MPGGGHLDVVEIQFQLLLKHCFVAVGLQAGGLSALALALLEIFGDTPMLWHVSTYACLVPIVGYMPLYLWRRSTIQASTSPVTIAVTIGYGIAAVRLSLTAWEGFWEPSAGGGVGFVLWVLFSSGLIFASVFEDFI